MSKPNRIQGEGDYEAAKEYNEAQRKFVKSGKVGAAARNAKPKSEAEERNGARRGLGAVAPRKRIQRSSAAAAGQLAVRAAERMEGAPLPVSPDIEFYRPMAAFSKDSFRTASGHRGDGSFARFEVRSLLFAVGSSHGSKPLGNLSQLIPTEEPEPSTSELTSLLVPPEQLPSS
jgi:hypothetical protein